MTRTIVVGIDGSATAGEALTKSVELARSLGATLHVVSAFHAWKPDAGPIEVRAQQQAADTTEAVLERAAAAVREQGVQVATHAAAGSPGDVLIDVAEQVSADLIVVGSQGLTGAKRFLLGSVPNNVAHHARCDVMIVRTGDHLDQDPGA